VGGTTWAAVGGTATASVTGAVGACEVAAGLQAVSTRANSTKTTILFDTNLNISSSYIFLNIIVQFFSFSVQKNVILLRIPPFTKKPENIWMLYGKSHIAQEITG